MPRTLPPVAHYHLLAKKEPFSLSFFGKKLIEEEVVKIEKETVIQKEDDKKLLKPEPPEQIATHLIKKLKRQLDYDYDF